MSMMTATAVITAIDRASPIFARVAGAARTASGRYAAAAGAFSAAGHKMHGALALAAPTGLGIGMFGFDQYEYDKASHQFRAIAELTKEQFALVQGEITNVSNAFGVNKTELLDAAKGWQELGNSPESFIRNLNVAARTSRITGVSVAEQMKETSALMRAFGYSMSDDKMFKHFEEGYLVASKGMKGGAHAFGEAMQAWAPVAAGLGLTFEEAAAFPQTLGGQFDPSKIGNALKTGFMRLAAPVPKSKAMMQALGIDPADFARFDDAKLRDADALIRGLRGTGSFSITPAIERLISSELERADLSRGIDPLSERLNETLAKAMGGSKMSAQDRKILQASILNHIGAAVDGVDPAGLFKSFAPHARNVAALSTIFGKEHGSVFMDLFKQSEHFLHNLENIHKHASGAVERRWSIFFEGFFANWDRFRAGVDNFMNSIGGSGIKDDLAKMFGSMAEGFQALQNVNPDVLRAGFWGIAGLAALAPIGFALSGIATSLTAVGTAAQFVTGILAGGSLAAALGALGSVAVVGGIGAAAYAAYEIYANWDKLKQIAADPVNLKLNWPEIPDWLENATRWLGAGIQESKDREWNEQVIAQRDGWWAAQKYRWGHGPGEVADTHGLHGETVHDDLSLMKVDLAEWASRLSVSGTVAGKVGLEATIRVEGPGTVVDKKTSGGEIKGKLNTGKSMPDAGSGGGH